MYHVVPTLPAALKAVDAGVDGLVVEGGEGGGFKSPTPVSTMVLLPLIRSRVDVPIIAAGGITDGATMAAAFALGAEGVQMGTRMVSAAESPVHDNWKQAIVDAAETDTLFLNQRHSPALRALRTEKTEALVDAPDNVFGEFGDAQALYFGGDMNAAIALSRAGRRTHRRRCDPVADIIADTVREFGEVVARLQGLMSFDGQELIGYLASALVVASLAMTSVVRLRTISLAGSITFVVYGLLIGSMPIVITNASIAVPEHLVPLPRARRPPRPRCGRRAHPTRRSWSTSSRTTPATSPTFQPEYEPTDPPDFAIVLTRDGLPAGVVLGDRSTAIGSTSPSTTCCEPTATRGSGGGCTATGPACSGSAGIDRRDDRRRERGTPRLPRARRLRVRRRRRSLRAPAVTLRVSREDCAETTSGSGPYSTLGRLGRFPHDRNRRPRRVRCLGAAGEAAHRRRSRPSTSDDVRGFESGSFRGCLFLSCDLLTPAQAGYLTTTGATVIRDDVERPYSAHRAHLYTPEELFAGFDPACGAATTDLRRPGLPPLGRDRPAVPGDDRREPGPSAPRPLDHRSAPRRDRR